MSSPVKVVAVTSGKGGVGKTTVAVNLAATLAHAGNNVLLLDADLGLANIDVLLGLTPERTLQEVIDGACTLADVMIKGPAGINVIPAASGVQKMAELDDLERNGLLAAFDELVTPIDVMIIDTAAGIASNSMYFCDASQEVLVVVCDDPASITDAYATIKVLNRRTGRDRFRVLVNMAHSERAALNIYAGLLRTCDRYLDVALDYCGVIPYCPEAAKSARQRRPAVLAYPHSRIAGSFKKLALGVDTWKTPQWASGRLEFFIQRIAKTTVVGGMAGV
ncbi:MAG: MinD/ParA family protein [Pseudomonadota bacterium]